MRGQALFLLAAACFQYVDGFFFQSNFLPTLGGKSKLLCQQRHKRDGYILSNVKCQSESVSGEASGLPTALNEEMVLLMALKQLKKDELSAGSKILVFGEFKLFSRKWARKMHIRV